MHIGNGRVAGFLVCVSDSQIYFELILILSLKQVSSVLKIFDNSLIRGLRPGFKSGSESMTSGFESEGPDPCLYRKIRNTVWHHVAVPYGINNHILCLYSYILIRNGCIDGLLLRYITKI